MSAKAIKELSERIEQFDSKVKLYSVDTDNTLKAKFEFNISNDVDDKGRKRRFDTDSAENRKYKR